MICYPVRLTFALMIGHSTDVAILNMDCRWFVPSWHLLDKLDATQPDPMVACITRELRRWSNNCIVTPRERPGQCPAKVADRSGAMTRVMLGDPIMQACFDP